MNKIKKIPLKINFDQREIRKKNTLNLIKDLLNRNSKRKNTPNYLTIIQHSFIAHLDLLAN